MSKDQSYHTKPIKTIVIFCSGAKPSKHTICSSYHMMCKNSCQSSSQTTKINGLCGVACLGGFSFEVSHEVPVIWWLDICRKIHFQGGSLVCLAVWCGLLAGSFSSLLIGISPRLLKLLTYRHLASFVMSDRKEQGKSHNALHKLASKVLYLLFHPILCVIETWPVLMWEDTRVWITGEADH